MERKAFAAECTARVDAELERLLPLETEPPRALHSAMRYAVFSGGKRLRPALAFASALACGAERDRALPVAAAVELLHAYSLVHDDLPAMDDDAERRGSPTVHVRYGESTAILAGDALQASAFEALSAADAPPSLLQPVILRLALVELLYIHGVPPKAVMNEAVDLARTFGTEDSARFVNGVLGRLATPPPQKGEATPE